MEATKEALEKKKQRSRLWKGIKRDRWLYIFLIPVAAYYLIFKFGPMYGALIAFKDYKISDGIWGSAWVGLKHFERVFRSPDFLLILKNTLLLNIYSVIFAFPIPILLAILLNEIKNAAFKRVSQSILYLPHFISWVVLAGIFIGMLSPSTGVVNAIIRTLGGEPVYFMADTFWWPVMFVISGIWQGAGWGTIIFLAAITGIDAELFEAAKIDGAGKLKQITNITLPCIKGTIVIMLILRMGSMMDIGFEHIFLLSNSAVRQVSDVISTYVYRLGIEGAQYSYTTAIGLFQSLVSMVLLFSTNKISQAMGETGLW